MRHARHPGDVPVCAALRELMLLLTCGLLRA
jgi:hypothetical protein